MTGHSNPYAVLGVTRTATPAEITHAFRDKLRSLHPDTRSSGVGDAELRELLTAYGQLRDPGRRAEYDRAAAAARPRPASPNSGPVAPAFTRTNPVGPVQIPVTHRRTDQPPRAQRPLWAGPVRRHP